MLFSGACSRKTAVKRILRLVKRVEDINNDDADRHYVNRIRDVIIYGSFVTQPGTEKVDKVNIYIIDENNQDKLREYRKRDITLRRYSTSAAYTEIYNKIQYTTKGSKFFDVCNNVVKDSDTSGTIIYNPHIYIYKDYKPCDDIREKLLKEG